MSIRTAIYFLSDLHLGARYITDRVAAERHVVSFLESIRHDAARIYLVGDILDYWYEYRYVVPRGFVRFFGKLAELADDGIEITWLIGNHDIWIFDYLPSELGIKVVDGYVDTTIDGKRFFITHGDAVDKSSYKYTVLRRIFRNRFCQWLYAAIHPRWTIPFALGWSRSSRDTSSRAAVDFAPSVQRLVNFSEQYAERHGHVDFFTFGHLHIVEDKKIANDARLIVLGEWIHTFSYARYDGGNLEISTYGNC